MEWKTKSSLIDCGIFKKRHMKTYMGWLSDWACRLANENVPYNIQNKQINDLRNRYIAKILLHNLNESIKPLVKSLNKFLELGTEKITELYRTGMQRI
ncbi:hypothetical protein Hanom_Chr15g01389381 [Helianthus anomalus]